MRLLFLIFALVTLSSCELLGLMGVLEESPPESRVWTEYDKFKGVNKLLASSVRVGDRDAI